MWPERVLSLFGARVSHMGAENSRRWEVCYYSAEKPCVLIFHQLIRGNRDPEQVKTVYQTAEWLAKAEVAPPS